jgi:dihydrolipoamide dehydrogenase
MTDSAYDLLVIGAGPGGYYGAIRGAQLGLRTACVEKEATLGGTCLNIGCIPSKALLESSESYAHAKSELGAHGVKVGDVSLDLPAMMRRKDKVVEGLTKGVAALFKKNGVEHLTGHARLITPGTVEISGSRVSAKSILLATGSTAVELSALPFDGKRILSSTEALALASVPTRMLVVGGGYIGLEMASVWSRLGSKVTVAELTPQILPGADRQMADELHKSLRRQKIGLRLETQAKAATVSADGVRVMLETKGEASEETFDVVLVAVGRRPYTDGLGLEQLGIATDERGRIRIDEHYRTNVPGVFAIGDCVPGPMLAHKAEDEAVACVERICGIAGHVNYDAIPAIVYTMPELASVGMTEERARADVGAVKIGTFPFRANSRARCVGESEGLAKMIAAADDDRILGVHVLGPAASEIIAEAAIAMEFRASAEDIARSAHGHPTFAEVLKEAALAVDKRAINF